jgi:hypothetical protein
VLAKRPLDLIALVMARCTSAAATAESTPPERPQIARPVAPTVSCTFLTVCSMKCPGVQSGVQRQMPNRKLARISPPRTVWATSGWNSRPESGLVSCWKAATGAFALEAVVRKPGGAVAMRSP